MKAHGKEKIHQPANQSTNHVLENGPQTATGSTLQQMLGGRGAGGGGGFGGGRGGAWGNM